MDDEPVRRAYSSGRPGGVERPADRPVRPLTTQDEVDAALNGRPQLLQALDVAGDQVAVPGAGGQVGADVGVESLRP